MTSMNTERYNYLTELCKECRITAEGNHLGCTACEVFAHKRVLESLYEVKGKIFKRKYSYNYTCTL
ncbi:MAG: hypothetical protein FWG70_01080 [Oscillospiraceae bacterium]|nr:hypothetical protein [Oscillospiraceae bacterium]